MKILLSLLMAFQSHTATIFDRNVQTYVRAAPNHALYADYTPFAFKLYQISPSTWAIRLNAIGRNWCGVTGSINAAWITCTAGGPGPHELFKGKCLGTSGYSQIAYAYGEESWGKGEYNNLVANAGPTLGNLLSFSPSLPDDFYINYFCN